MLESEGQAVSQMCLSFMAVGRPSWSRAGTPAGPGPGWDPPLGRDPEAFRTSLGGALPVGVLHTLGFLLPVADVALPGAHEERHKEQQAQDAGADLHDLHHADGRGHLDGRG